MVRISKRSVDAAKPKAKDTYLWDDELAGFGLKVTPTGRKVYLVQYRVGGRKARTRRVTIGPHGSVTPDAARVEAKRLLGQVAASIAEVLGRRKLDIRHTYVGNYFTSLEMMGVTLTMIRLDGELDRLLAYPARSLGLTNLKG